MPVRPSPGPLNAGKRVSANTVSAAVELLPNLRPLRVEVAVSRKLLKTPAFLPGLDPRLVTLTARP